jgi:phosphohistidine swiveling domain-containing protein
MLTEYCIPLSDSRAILENVGGKGASLARLYRAGLPVPGGFHVTTAAYQQFVAVNNLQPAICLALQKAELSTPGSLDAVSDAIRQEFSRGGIPEDIAAAIRQAYLGLSEKTPMVAVRSSATAEDLPDLSFAGQQETYLNIQGAPAVLEAVKRCWASLWTARALSYRSLHNIDHDSVSLGVVVQLLIPADAAGILFSAHPVTGQRDRVMISAAWGLGEAIVSGAVTPDTVIVDKQTGRVITRETADKQTMTVCLEGGTGEQPVPENIRRAPVLSDKEAADLTHLSEKIETLFEMPVDIEWVRTEKKMSIVQARPITTLPEPEPAPRIHWKLPKGQYAAMRNNIVELMVDPLTPLFDTLGRTAINASLQRLMTLFFGRPGVVPEEIIISVNGYAYNNGSLRLVSLLRVLFDIPGILRRMFTGAVERWTEIGLPRYAAAVEHWQSMGWREFSAKELVGAARELSEAAFDAYGALVSGVIPAAWISEAVFTFTYNLLIKQRSDPPPPVFLLGFDSIPIRAEKSLYDLTEWVRLQTELAAYLVNTPAPQLATHLKDDRRPSGVDPEAWGAWQNRFQAHLVQYGHTIYNLDFANPVPADDPTALLETCRLFIIQQGANPYSRQKAAALRREQAVQSMLMRLKGLRLKLFNKSIHAAQRFAPLREDGLADVGLSYPLLRQMLLELGRRFTVGGLIQCPEDIFWLNQDEVEQAADRLDRGEPLNSLSSAVPPRKTAWRAAKLATPPTRLPHLTVPGLLLKMRGGSSTRRGGDTIKGVAASPGRATGSACVVNSPQDFGQMKPGDVLVAAITTPAWTPLFARAAAIVTDVGGPLSHGSIVAREYGIPAVLGTGDATRRIHSGQVITVDGSAGVVFVGKKRKAGD